MSAPGQTPPPAQLQRKRRPLLLGIGIGGAALAALLVTWVVVASLADDSVASGEAAFVEVARTASPGLLGRLTDDQIVTAGRGICTEPSTISRGDAVTRFASSRELPPGAATTIVDAAVTNMCPQKQWPAVSQTAPTHVYTYTPATTTPPAPPAPPRAITARDWQLIAKNPDAHIGERVIVYGEVTQFDAATGTSAFRANVDGVVHKVKYGYADYKTNTVLTTGSSSLFTDVVTGDLFRAEATVLGSFSYGTQIGGSTTVPQLMVTAIKVTGSTDR